MRMNSFQFEKHWFKHRSMKFSKKTKSEISKSVIFCVCTVWRERKKRKKSGNALIWSQNQRNSAEKKKTQLQVTKSEISKPINFDFFVYAVFGAREKAKETASEKSNIQISKNSFSSKSSNRSELEKDKSRFREIDIERSRWKRRRRRGKGNDLDVLDEEASFVGREFVPEGKSVFLAIIFEPL